MPSRRKTVKGESISSRASREARARYTQLYGQYGKYFVDEDICLWQNYTQWNIWEDLKLPADLSAEVSRCTDAYT
jgi:hypothetical protein